MKSFTISRNNLLGALLRCQHAINRKAGIPAFLNYWFSFSDNRLLVSASDSELFMQESLALDMNIGTNDVTFGLDRYYLLSTIKSLDEQPLNFEVMDYQIKVKHSHGSFWLQKEDVEAVLSDMVRRNSFDLYVTKGDSPEVNHIQFEVPGIKHWVDLCYNSLAGDYLRPAMNCIILDFMGDNILQIAASDGHQMTVIKKQQEGADFTEKLLLPKKVCQIIQKCLPKTGMMDLDFTGYMYKKNEETEEVHKQKSVGMFTVCLDNDDTEHTLFVKFRDTVMDSLYPRYQSVIPTKFNYFMECDRIELLKSINRVIRFTATSGKIRFHIREDILTISSEDKDFAVGASEDLTCELTTCGPAIYPMLNIGFKGSTFASLLKRIGTERIRMSFVDSVGVCVLQPEPQPEVENLTFLMKPMIL